MLCASVVLAGALSGPGPAAQAAQSCFGKQATIVGTDGPDDIRGTPRADVIVGLGGADSIRGLRGADLICAGRGFDKVWGGSGDDRLVGAAEFWPGPGRDVVRGNGWSKLHYDNAKGPVNVDLRAGTATGQGRDALARIYEVVGSPYRDVIAGDDLERLGGAGNVLQGNGGADLLDGRGGDDVLFDGLRGDAGCDIADSEGADLLRGGPGSDSIHFGDGNDRAVGGGRIDGFFVEGAGDDVVRGGSGPDYLSFFCVGPVQASLADGRATTTQGSLSIFSIKELQGSEFDDVLTGDGNPNYLGGGAGRDVIAGRGGDDTLWGGAGDDSLDGGSGTDTGFGGDGVDTCTALEERNDCEL